jgi:hypothetical protein
VVEKMPVGASEYRYSCYPNHRKASIPNLLARNYRRYYLAKNPQWLGENQVGT